MNFRQVYEALKNGAKIKRPHWKGYWVKENVTIAMHCKDGSVINFLETDDIFVDLDNIVAEDWIVVDNVDESTLNISTFTFGEAISNLKRGKKVARKGWNGKGIFLELQLPDEHSKMTHPYIYIDTTGLQTDNINAPKDRVPWLASQTDILSQDWIIVD